MVNRIIIFLLQIIIVLQIINCSKENASLEDKIKDRIICSLSIPPQVEVKIGKIEDSDITGLKKVKVEFYFNDQTQERIFYITNDYKFLITGEAFDLTKDPRKEVLDKILIKNRAYRGNKEAKLLVIEFIDFQCPYCLRAYNILMKELLPKYKDKIKLYIKHFPLEFHNWAKVASLASECAYLQNEDAFWKVHDYIFENQKELTNENFNEKMVSILSEVKGFNLEKFKKCVETQETAQIIENDMKEAEEIGVRGTPTFIINGRVIRGFLPLDILSKIIEEELRR